MSSDATSPADIRLKKACDELRPQGDKVVERFKAWVGGNDAAPIDETERSLFFEAVRTYLTISEF